MADKESNVSVLSTWFENAGGSLDSSAMGFATFPEAGGRGAVALRDLDVRRQSFSYGMSYIYASNRKDMFSSLSLVP
jgi:hypothetical protein